MQSLKKIHAWAQMKVPLFSVSFLNMIKNQLRNCFMQHFLFIVVFNDLLYIFVFVLLSYEIYCLTIQCNDKKVHCFAGCICSTAHTRCFCAANVGPSVGTYRMCANAYIKHPY